MRAAAKATRGRKAKRKAKVPTLDKRSVRAYLSRMAKRATSPTKPKAVGYCRVSTNRQRDTGGSLSVQRDRLVEYAVLGGLDLVATFEDAVSGAKGEDERPGFKAAIDAIRAGEATTLLVTDVDRLARDADEIGHAKVEVRKAGGKIVVLSESGASVELVAVRTLLAVLEREKIRARMRTWSAARLAAGKPMGPAGFGFRKSSDGRLERDPETWPTVERIASDRARGLSLRRIADALTAEGVAAPGGSKWNPMTVSSIAKAAGSLA